MLGDSHTRLLFKNRSSFSIQFSYKWWSRRVCVCMYFFFFTLAFLLKIRGGKVPKHKPWKWLMSWDKAGKEKTYALNITFINLSGCHPKSLKRANRPICQIPELCSSCSAYIPDWESMLQTATSASSFENNLKTWHFGF